MRGVNLGVRFVLELAALAALAAWGWHAGDSPAVRLLLAVAAPLVAAVAWGAWVAPRATRRLPDPWRLGVEGLVFAAASAGLLAMHATALAVTLAAAYLVNVVLLFGLR